MIAGQGRHPSHQTANGPRLPGFTPKGRGVPLNRALDVSAAASRDTRLAPQTTRVVTAAAGFSATLPAQNPPNIAEDHKVGEGAHVRITQLCRAARVTLLCLLGSDVADMS